MFDIHNFGSGSSGNSTLISDGDTSIIIDIGLSTSRIKKGILQAGYKIEDVSAVLVTHLHCDHFLPKLLDTFPPKIVYGSFFIKGGPEVNYIEPFTTFTVGSLKITTLMASHDDIHVENTIGFRVENRLGEALIYLTDTGFVPQENIPFMHNADIYMIESNYDNMILQNESTYTQSMKDRIDGDAGHLSNHDAALAVFCVSGPKTKQIILLHLSKENNRPSVAVGEFKTVFSIDPKKRNIKFDFCKHEEATHFKW